MGPTVEPCVHFTSSAWISSCGWLSARASVDSSRLLLVWFESVRWAPGRTMMRPLNTPWARWSSTPLKYSWLSQWGCAWSITVWWSACCPPPRRYRPFSVRCPPGPARTVCTSWRDSAPQRDGVAAQHAVARLVHVGRGDVKRVATLALHAAILHARALADRELRHRVRPVHAIREDDVALHHRGARPALHDHHVARVGDERLGRRDRDEHQVQRLVHFYSGRHVHERAIVEKGRVERREGVGGGRPGVAPEVPPDQVPVMPAGV